MKKERLMKAVTAAAAGLAAVLLCAGTAAAQPANNACVNAQVIGYGTFDGTTILATNDGSASCGSSGANADVWYRFVAPATANVTVETCGNASYDTVLSVHSGVCPATTGTQLACNDDSCGIRSRVVFQAINGVEYLIRVSGFSNRTGTFSLTVSTDGSGQPPANDTCDGALPIGNGTVNGSNNSASGDGDAACAGPSAPDVYYRYTAPATGAVAASTCGGANFNTAISVHSGCPATTENQIACNDNFCVFRSQVEFEAVQGQEYIIRVAGIESAGAFQLTLGDPPPPSTDGPDVTHQHINSIAGYGVVGGVRAYALGSDTCNIGTENLLWTGQGTPALAMNAYRLQDGRLVQIGLGFAKTACCAIAGSGCGTCNGAGGSVLGAGCKDVYSAGFNGVQSNLAPRSSINGYTAVIGSFPATSGNAIFRRLQIAQSDLTTANFPGARYIVEGAYMATDDAAAGKAMNNNSYMIVNVDQSSFELLPATGTYEQIPAIQAWRDHGLGNNTTDPSVGVFSVDVPGEGRFWIATKVTDRGDGTFLYDYAVYNMNSDRSGGSLSVPRGLGVTVTDIGFHDVNYHSGEPYDNTDWTNALTSAAVTWSSPQTFAQNPNSNALRWGTMYNFWFVADSAPTPGTVTLGLFKPGTPTEIAFDVPVPTPLGVPCTADFDDNGEVEVPDIFAFLSAWFAGDESAEFDGVCGIAVPDIFAFLSQWFAGCP